MYRDLETERLINFVTKLNSPRAAEYSEIVTYFSRLNESIIRYFCIFLQESSKGYYSFIDIDSWTCANFSNDKIVSVYSSVTERIVHYALHM